MSSSLNHPKYHVPAWRNITKIITAVIILTVDGKNIALFHIPLPPAPLPPQDNVGLKRG